jgi:hypothetical protein
MFVSDILLYEFAYGQAHGERPAQSGVLCCMRITSLCAAVHGPAAAT